jgi:hypothetical protein
MEMSAILVFVCWNAIGTTLIFLMVYNPNHRLLENYLYMDAPRSPMNISRTLNQFQYYMTADSVSNALV